MGRCKVVHLWCHLGRQKVLNFGTFLSLNFQFRYVQHGLKNCSVCVYEYMYIFVSSTCTLVLILNIRGCDDLELAATIDFLHSVSIVELYVYFC